MEDSSIDCAGNARMLTQIHECEDLFSTYSTHTASEITAIACHRGGFDNVKAEQIPGALELIRAFRSKDVNVRAERETAELKAKAMLDEMIGTLTQDEET